MKVLRVAHHGVVSAWRERERALISAGVEVRMVSAHRWNEGGREVDLSVDGDEFVVGARTVGRHPGVFLYDPRILWRALGSDFDVIDLHEEPFALATAEVLLLRWLRRVRTPYVLYSAQNLAKRYPVPFRWFERAALRGAAAAYVCNREAGEILVRKGLRGPARLIPLGVDTERIAPAGRAAPVAPAVVGYVGRLERYKGVDVLLRAAAARPAWRIEVSGDGPAGGELIALAVELGIDDRVSFLGFTAADALAERYRRLDVLAMPSLPWPGWREQFGRVAVEAMAAGVPVVASRTGALPDVVGDAGVLVDPGDAASLTAGIDAALDVARWTGLRAAGIERAREFGWQRVAAHHEALYREVRDAGSLRQMPDRGSGRGRPPQVVAVAYGDPDLLEGALAALGDGYGVTIVDNSSSALTREMAARRGAEYIDPGRNLGFGSGVNVAVRSLVERGLSADDVLLLNPDARISAAEVAALHETMHADPRIAAVGATQTEPASGDEVRVWWPFPSPLRAWIEAVGLGHLNRARDFAIGSVLLLRAEALALVGEFDERFFLYAEEVDWQKRAVDAGWRIEVADVAATHIGGATSGDATLRDALFFASNEIYQRKHFGPAGWAMFRAAMIAGAAVRSIVLSAHGRDQARQRLAVFVTGPAEHLRRVRRAGSA